MDSSPLSPESVEWKLRQLTQRQCEILYWVCRGLDYREVGQKIGWGEDLVQREMSHLYKSLGLTGLSRTRKRELLTSVICPIHLRLVRNPETDCIQRALVPVVGPPEPEPEIMDEVKEDQKKGLIPLRITRGKQTEEPRALVIVPPILDGGRRRCWDRLIGAIIGAGIVLLVLGIIRFFPPGTSGATATATVSIGEGPSSPTPIPEPTSTYAPTETPTTSPTVTWTVTRPPTLTPNPTETPRPTATVPPPPTVSLDTPPGSILQPGEYWKQGGLALVLEKTHFNVQYGCASFDMTLYNDNQQSIILTIAPSQFSLKDNTGRIWTPGAVNQFHADCPFTTLGPFSIQLGPKKDIGGWSAQFAGPLSDPQVTSLVLTVNGLSRISNARWSISIGR